MSEHPIPRTVLPIPNRPRTGLITYDAKAPETSYPPIRQLRPPPGAPEDYGPHGNAFNGVVKGVELSIADGAESADHMVSPEEAVRIAMARQ